MVLMFCEKLSFTIHVFCWNDIDPHINDVWSLNLVYTHHHKHLRCCVDYVWIVTRDILYDLVFDNGVHHLLPCKKLALQITTVKNCLKISIKSPIWIECGKNLQVKSSRKMFRKNLQSKSSAPGLSLSKK